MLRVTLFILLFSIPIIAKTNLEVIDKGKENSFNKILLESLKANGNYDTLAKEKIEFKIIIKKNKVKIVSNLEKNKFLILKISENKLETTSEIIKFIENNKAKKVKFSYISSTIKKSLHNLIKNRPEITGKIISMPEAGSLGVKFDSSFRNIEQGIKLRAKRKEFNKLEKAGIFYLRERNNKIEAKYLRSEVGKFEVGDVFSTKWYKPVFIIGKIIDENDSEILKELRQNLLIKLIKLAKSSSLKFIFHEKLESLVQSVTSFNKRKILRRLYGLGIDYFVEGFLKNEEATDLNFRVYSTYTGELLLSINL